MKVLFLYSRNEPDIRVSGEAKKMIMQIDGMKAHGVECDLMYHNRSSIWNKLLIRIPFLPIYSKSFCQEFVSKAMEYDAVYIRKYIFDRSFIKLLGSLPENVKKLVEIPTYPYDSEWKSWIDLPLLLKDKNGRCHLRGLIDRFVTYSNDEEIFNIKCINTSNGIDINKITLKRKFSDTEKTLHLIGVANVEEWHGFDRLLVGMKLYYDNKDYSVKVIFHIVGGGAAIPKLKGLVNKFRLTKYVVFHGPLHGKELDEVFDNCDIGIGSLGMHRIGLDDGYTLKLREYAARGIPFIYAYNDHLIERHNSSIILKFPNDDSSIDIKKVVSFYQSLRRLGLQFIAHRLRADASECMTWSEQMSPIYSYLKNQEDNNNG